MNGARTREDLHIYILIILKPGVGLGLLDTRPVNFGTVSRIL